MSLTSRKFTWDHRPMPDSENNKRAYEVFSYLEKEKGEEFKAFRASDFSVVLTDYVGRTSASIAIKVPKIGTFRSLTGLKKFRNFLVDRKVTAPTSEDFKLWEALPKAAGEPSSSNTIPSPKVILIIKTMGATYQYI